MNAKRRTPGVPGRHLGRLPATPGSRGIQRRVNDIAAPQAEALGSLGALSQAAHVAPGRREIM